MNSVITRDWYSEEYVKDIFTPKLSTWRSRYDLKEQLLLKDDILVIRNMRKSDLVPTKTSSDIEYEVEAKEAYRPDIIANKVYGDPRLAWVILAANNLKDIFTLEAGMRIIIPSAVSIYMSGGVMAR